MCGIVGAIATRSVTAILLEGLKRLEYRGYDSAGIAVLNNNEILRTRTQGKVAELEAALKKNALLGNIGIAHTRWATHGGPLEHNAHPHISQSQIALVHNGIIENHEALKQRLSSLGYALTSETDTEIIAHLVHHQINQGKKLLEAVRAVVAELEGTFALGIIDSKDPHTMVAVRCGSPLVIGVGDREHFIASDQLALLPVTNKFIYLEEGDIAELSLDHILILDSTGKKVNRTIHICEIHHDTVDKGLFRHYMLKEIYDQPEAITATLGNRLGSIESLEKAFGDKAPGIFSKVEQIHFVACGTSYHAGRVAKYWIEELARIPCQVEVASEFRYRKVVVSKNTLLVTISQSGETADTLAALRTARDMGYLASLCICNVEHSTLVRESDLCLLTRAGVEIGVASTKAFTTQLVALLLLTRIFAHHRGLPESEVTALKIQLERLPKIVRRVIGLNNEIKKLAEKFVNKNHALFLGRGVQYPIACEGALKLKEISYIHAEAYPAGELKHGPLALVDKEMPVIAIAPNDELLEKLKSNLHEVRARGGELFVFADESANFTHDDGLTIIPMPSVDKYIAPIVYTIPLQLLAYHVAVLKGTDVDQPRNLAKSVTVE